MFSFQNWVSFPATPVPPGPSPPGIPGPQGPPGSPGPQGEPGEGVVSRSIEIDFGSVPVEEASFIIVDPEITAASRITGSIAYLTPTGKSLDELTVDDITLRFGSGAGQFTIFARSLRGAVSGKFVVHYFISASP